MKTHLPGDDEFWKAASAEEWFQLYQMKPSGAVGPSFPIYIRHLMSKEDDSPLREQSILRMRLLINSVARMLWTWKDIHSLIPSTFDRIGGWQNEDSPVIRAATRINW